MPELLTFGPFCLNISDRQLTRAGALLDVQPLVIDLFIYGALNPDRLLTREELQQVLWPETHVLDHSLSQLVHKLRRVLGEHKGWWKTVPRRGYRFDRPQTHTRPALPARPLLRTLPPSRDRFIGRDAALSQISAVLERGSRLITISGFGGVGKTRLAVEALRRQPSTRWPDGRWMCRLSEAQTLDAFFVEVARTLGVSLGGSPCAQIGAALRGHGRALLLLDNLEQLLPAVVPVIDRWLDDAPEVAFVTTSRAPLRARGEVVISVAPLPLDDAMTLLCERALLSTEDQKTLQAVVEQLDRLPLAIELAAPYARSITLNGLARRLADGLGTPPPPHLGRAPRQQTIDATLQWSWSLLQPDEQRALSQCSVFEGGFTFEAAEAVLALSSPRRVEDVLVSLIEQNLLDTVEGHWTGEPRMQMLRSTRTFVAPRLSSRRAVEQRHGAFCARYASFTLDALGMRSLLEERHNVVAACHRAIERGDVCVAIDCATAAGRVYTQQGPLHQGIALFEQIESQLPLQGHHSAQLHLGIAALLTETATLPDVEDRLLEAGAALDRLPAAPEHLRMRHQVYLGMLRWWQGQFQQARALLERAQPQAQALGAETWVAQILSALGGIEAHQGKHHRAAAFYQRALRSATADRAPWVRATVLGNLGVIYADTGDPRAAERLQQALQLTQQIGDLQTRIWTLEALGTLHCDRGQLRSARATVEAALAEARRIGARNLEPELLSALGRIAGMNGDLNEGRTLLLDALEHLPPDHPHRARSLLRLGRLEADADNIAGAHARYAAGLAIADPTYASIIRAYRSALWLREGALDDAVADLKAAQHLDQLANTRGILIACRGMLLAKRGLPDQAQAVFQRGEALYQQGKLVMFCELSCAHAEATLLDADPTKARPILSRIAQIMEGFEMPPRAPIRKRHAELITMIQ
ncbi:MAG: tetratricopeptide repeat protein [Myxococcota bacterium]